LLDRAILGRFWNCSTPRRSLLFCPRFWPPPTKTKPAEFISRHVGYGSLMSGAAIGPESFDWNIANHWLDSMPIIFTTGGIIVLIYSAPRAGRAKAGDRKSHQRLFKRAGIGSLRLWVRSKSSFNSGVIFGVASVSLVLLCSSARHSRLSQINNPNIAENGDSSAVRTRSTSSK